ncbi:MAG: zinc-binding dehydrogenase [Nitrospiraceae bacterium]|nr:zinc-binding dehydrogenase [Nitrospiraceae bacterium]
MKAIVLREFGGPDVLRYEEIERPVPHRGEVLVKVKAVSVNHVDIWVRSGLTAYGTKLPHVPGCDISGEVFEVAPDVKDWKPGDKVLVDPGIRDLKCEFCLTGRNNICDHFGIIGAAAWGGYAEYAKVNADNLLRIPRDMDFETAAAFPLTFMTAWHMLAGRACVTAGETVLVIAGGSGIGVAAIQIARLHGAKVIATAGGKEKTLKAADLGADYVIDHKSEDICQRVMDITRNRGVDVVFEHVGPATFGKSLRSLRKGGRLVTCGATTGPEVAMDLRYVFSRQLDIMGSIMGTRQELLRITELFAEKKLEAVIDQSFPLEEARRAHEKMEKSAHFGKLLLVPQA